MKCEKFGSHIFSCQSLPLGTNVPNDTKILRIVSSVLFSYSTITHLPSKHTTLVWSVDANVPLLGVRFILLFIVCLILFIILIPFNVILLFTRTLSRFRFISKFKPLLDAYQGPYKDKFYHWTGLQLLIRVAFFWLSSLDRNINLIVSAILLTFFVGICGVVQPFKSKVKNYQELFLLLNLHGLYVISLHQNNPTIVNVIIIIAAVHFIFIITYHIITYMIGGVIRDKIQLNISTFTGWIKRSCKKYQHQQFELQDVLRDKLKLLTTIVNSVNHWWVRIIKLPQYIYVTFSFRISNILLHHAQ